MVAKFQAKEASLPTVKSKKEQTKRAAATKAAATKAVAKAAVKKTIAKPTPKNTKKYDVWDDMKYKPGWKGPPRHYGCDTIY